MLRPSRVIAVARSEAREHMSGRQALRLLGVAAALLLPASWFVAPTRLPLPSEMPVERTAETADFLGPLEAPPVPVRGTIPAGLERRLALSDRTLVEIRAGDPVVVVAPEVSRRLRDAMETIEGPVRVEVRGRMQRARRPGRSLILAVIAISLLTGPLADSLPGERARRTLEVLLSAGITRGEMLVGKWMAWTSWASATAAVPAAIAVWRGVQEPGWWIAGLPLFVASTTAFGLWLVRLVDDVVGASATPMRVFPVVAGALTVLALVLERTSPVAAAVVPLGGALLVAGDLFQSGLQALAAAAGTAAFVFALLARTARDLDHLDAVGAPSRYGAAGLSGVATLMWWLVAAGPAVWNTGLATDMITPIERAMTIAGLALLCCAAVAVARESRVAAPATAVASSPLSAAFFAVLVGLLLAASGPLPEAEVAGARESVNDMLARLREAALPVALVTSLSAAFAGVFSVVGQTVLYRGVLAPRISWIGASLLWAVAVCPVAPWTTLAASLALGALGASHGAKAALAAHVLWAAGSSAGGIGASAALPLQAVAAAVSIAVWRTGRLEPSRHQS